MAGTLIKIFFFLLPFSAMGQMFGSLAADDYHAFQLFRASNGNIVTTTHRDGLNILAKEYKAYGFWNNAVAIYPFAGSDSIQHKYDLKNANGPFTLTFIGAWTCTSTGAVSGVNGSVIETHIIPSTSLNLDDVHGALYSRTTGTGSATAFDFGSNVSATQAFEMVIRRTGNVSASVIYDESGTIILPSVADGSGLFDVTRTSSTSHVMYQNGSSIGSSGATRTSTRPTVQIVIGGLNVGGVYTTYNSNKEYCFGSFGTGHSSAQAVIFYNMVQRYVTKLSR